MDINLTFLKVKDKVGLSHRKTDLNYYATTETASG